MSAADIAPPVARLKALVEAVPASGPVYPHDIYQRDDLAELVVSSIEGVDTFRAWWITGPRMTGERLTQTSDGYIERRWTYEIHGVEGLTANGDSLVTLRAQALAVTDSIDSDIPLSGTCHRSLPCSWRTAPENRVTWAGIACSYVVIEKTVITVSTP